MLGRLRTHKITLTLIPHCVCHKIGYKFFFQLPCLFQLFTLGRESECVATLRDKTQIFTQTNSSRLRIAKVKVNTSKLLLDDHFWDIPSDLDWLVK